MPSVPSGDVVGETIPDAPEADDTGADDTEVDDTEVDEPELDDTGTGGGATELVTGTMVDEAPRPAPHPESAAPLAAIVRTIRGM